MEETAVKAKRQLTEAQKQNWEKARAARLANIEKRKAESVEAKEERKARMKMARALAKKLVQEEEAGHGPTLPEAAPPTPAPPPPAPPAAASIDYEKFACTLADILESRMPVVLEAPPPESPKKPTRKPRAKAPRPVVPAPAPPPPQPVRYAPRLQFF